MEYQDLNDYELLHYISENIEEANDLVMDKYYPFVQNIVNKMKKYVQNCGLDENDLLQEGMVGLNDAIATFSEHEDTTFYTYAKYCVERKIISAIVKAHRKKHKILNESLSYDNPLIVLDKVSQDKLNDPLNIIISSDTESKLEKSIRAKLTNMEGEVFDLMISGFNIKEISEILNIEYKSVDNAIQRIRTKAKSVINK